VPGHFVQTDPVRRRLAQTGPVLVHFAPAGPFFGILHRLDLCPRILHVTDVSVHLHGPDLSSGILHSLCCGSAERGVVAAASYEARKFGVRSAMPSVTAKRQCPDLISVKPRFEVYKAMSRQIRDIFAEHTPIIEPLSLDEA
jgi:hypothetical protein